MRWCRRSVESGDRPIEVSRSPALSWRNSRGRGRLPGCLVSQAFCCDCSEPLLCRFSDAGSIDLTTRSAGRRPKSAKARNRFRRQWEGGAAGGRRSKKGYGDLVAGQSFRRFRPVIGRRTGIYNLDVPARMLLSRGFHVLSHQVFQRLSRPGDNFCAITLHDEHWRQHRASSFIAHFEALGCRAETLLILSSR
jgi:hypothetical protein